MKIECILKRQGGTVVDLDGKTYHFTPQADGAHVAEVADDEHIDKLLAVSEAYQQYDDGAHVAEVADDEQVPTVAPKARRKSATAQAEQPAADEQSE